MRDAYISSYDNVVTAFHKPLLRGIFLDVQHRIIHERFILLESASSFFEELGRDISEHIFPASNKAVLHQCLQHALRGASRPSANLEELEIRPLVC